MAMTLFGHLEPLSTLEMLTNYWHFLRSLDETKRAMLGPVEIFVSGQASIRGWPVGFKNPTMAVASAPTLTRECRISYVDIANATSVQFHDVHLILPFVTDGALSRSPHETKPAAADLKNQLLKSCEKLRGIWPAKIYFEEDPTNLAIDEMMNLNTVIDSILKAVPTLQENALMWDEMMEFKAFHIINARDSREILIGRRDSTEIEISFHFSRSLPGNVADMILTQLTGLI